MTDATKATIKSLSYDSGSTPQNASTLLRERPLLTLSKNFFDSCLVLPPERQTASPPPPPRTARTTSTHDVNKIYPRFSHHIASPPRGGGRYIRTCFSE